MSELPPLTSDLVIELARRRGLRLDDERVETFRLGLESLLHRIGQVGELLPLDIAPPPTRAPSLPR